MARRERPRWKRGLDVGVLAASVLSFVLLLIGKQKARDSGLGSGRGPPGTPPSAGASALGYETEDMSGGDMTLLTLGLGASVALAIGAMFLMLHFFHAADRRHPPFTAEQQAQIVPPAPHLQSHPQADLRDVRAREVQLLNEYAWLDAGHTVARIPIERAIALTVGQKLDAGP